MFCLLLAQSSDSEYYSCWYPLQFYAVRQLWPVSDLHFTVGVILVSTSCLLSGSVWIIQEALQMQKEQLTELFYFSYY